MLEQPQHLEPYVARMVKSDPSIEKLADRITSRGGSLDTVAEYVKAVYKFGLWTGVSPSETLASKPKFSSLLNDYITALSKEGHSSASISTKIAGLKKWLIANEACKRADLEEVEPPRVTRVSEDRLPTRAELKRILSAADLTDKVLALVAISSGLREKAIMDLRLSQFDGIELDEEGLPIQTRPIPRVLVLAEQSKNAKPYMSFVSPECAEAIVLYLRERQMRGEVLTPRSSLIVSVQFRQAMQRKSGATRWRAMLKRAGLDQKNEKGLNRINYLRFHNMRKFFKSWAALSGVSSDIAEFWMGHQAGIAAVYFMPGVNKLPEQVLERLEGEYKKMLSAITILSDDAEIEKLSTAIGEQNRKLEEERRRFELERGTWESRFLSLLKKVDELEKALPPQ